MGEVERTYLKDLEGNTLEVGGDLGDVKPQRTRAHFLVATQQREVVPRCNGEALNGFDGALPQREGVAERVGAVARRQGERTVGRGDARWGAAGAQRGEEEGKGWSSDLNVNVCSTQEIRQRELSADEPRRP